MLSDIIIPPGIPQRKTISEDRRRTCMLHANTAPDPKSGVSTNSTTSGKFVGLPGFEPRPQASRAPVLPLHHKPIVAPPRLELGCRD